MTHKNYFEVIELYKKCIIDVLENNTPISSEYFIETLQLINSAIDKAIVSGTSHNNLDELKNYISILKYDILMKHGKY